MNKEKQIEEMSCKKCLHYEMCLEKFRKAKDEGFWELTDEDEYFAHADECDFYAADYRKQGEWISVDERLPEKNVRVLVYIKSSRSYTRFDTDRLDDRGFVRWFNDVTHWMPLPEAPKMRKEDEGK